MNEWRGSWVFLASLVAVTGGIACGDDDVAGDGDVADTNGADASVGARADAGAPTTEEDAGWSEESHTKAGAPSYEQVFPAAAVKRIDVTVSPEDWQAMQADLTDMLGTFGSGGLGGGPGGGGPGGFPPDGGIGFPPDGGIGFPPDGGMGVPPDGGMLPGGGGASILPRDPIYVAATFRCEGRRWDHVGMRFKGNSSIASAWSQGIGKLPLRFNFSKMKDAYPDVADQRFWGFKDLSLSNVMNDDSFLREKLANDFFASAGLPIGKSAFYRVYVDHGEGATYFGLYVATEIPEDQFLEGTFGSEDGNLYKPESTLASFAEDEFEKKTNEDAADFSDVQGLIDALNADRSDPVTWRAGLDARLDTGAFMRWLATNTLVGNWDAYGVMAHNYYLYGVPAQAGRLAWLPWDSSLAMQAGGQAPSLSLDEVSAAWPLIRFTMDDEVYGAAYYAALAAVNDSFTAAALGTPIQRAHDLVAPYVVGADGEVAGYTFLTSSAAFTGSVPGLLEYVTARHEAAAAATAAP